MLLVLAFSPLSATRRSAARCDPFAVPSSGESHQQDELSPVNKVEPEPRDLSPIASERNMFHRIRTSAKRDRNSSGMCTYKIIGLKSAQNEHLQKRPSGQGWIVPSDEPERGNSLP